jgi:hypothetical protein
VAFFLGFALGFVIAGLLVYVIGARIIASVLRETHHAFAMMGEAFSRILVECERIERPTPAMVTAVEHAVDTLKTLHKAAGLDDTAPAQSDLEQEEQVG